MTEGRQTEATYDQPRPRQGTPSTHGLELKLAAMSKIETFDDFVKVHGLLLTASGLPRPLHEQLFKKLSADTFDGGACFQIEPCEDGRQRRLVLTSGFAGKESDVFLVDHTWTFRLSDAYKQVLDFLFRPMFCLHFCNDGNGHRIF